MWCVSLDDLFFYIGPKHRYMGLFIETQNEKKCAVSVIATQELRIKIVCRAQKIRWRLEFLVHSG